MQKNIKLLIISLSCYFYTYNSEFQYPNVNVTESQSNKQFKSFPKLPDYLVNLPGNLKELKKSLDRRGISVQNQISLLHIAQYYNLSEEVTKEFNFTSPRGILLYGPPGTGKSQIVKRLKNAISAENYFEFDLETAKKFGIEESQLYTKSGIEKFFEEVRKITKKSNSKSILFIDEIDDIGNSQSPILNALLTQIDNKNNKNILIIGATNFRNKLAESLKRSGRFDYEIYVPLPKGINRIDVILEELDKIGAKIKIELSKDDLIELSKQSKGFNLPDITNLVNRATLSAYTKNNRILPCTMHPQDLFEAVKRVKAEKISKSHLQKFKYSLKCRL